MITGLSRTAVSSPVVPSIYPRSRAFRKHQVVESTGIPEIVVRCFNIRTDNNVKVTIKLQLVFQFLLNLRFNLNYFVTI